MQGINFHIKSREATLTNFKISLLLIFRQFLTIGNYKQKLVIAVLYSCNLIQNGGIMKFSTHVK